MMPTVSSMALFHTLGQDAQEMQCDIFGHVMPLDQHHVMRSLINATTAFV